MKRIQELQEAQRQMDEADKKFTDQASFLIQKKKLDRIVSFCDFFDFLNNDYPSPIYFSGLMFRSVSHAFQAARTNDQYLKEKMSTAETPMEVFDIALQLDDPEDWHLKRLEYMEQIVRDKFRRSKDLKERLKATGSRELWNSYEEETMSNLFWGKVGTKGQNQLGRMLEHIRYDIKQNLELKRWIYTFFSLQEDKDLLPRIYLTVTKQGNTVEKIELQHKAFYLLGRLNNNDIILSHPSVSQVHAVIAIDQDLGPVIIDLESRSGTFLDLQKLEPHIPYQLKNFNSINFAFSSRKFTVQIDFSYVETVVNARQRGLKSDISLLEKLNDNPDEQAILESLGVMTQDTLFISNLPTNTSEKELKKIFQEYGKPLYYCIQLKGEIKSIRLPSDRHSGQLRGIGFIQFSNVASASKALRLDRFQLREKKLRVSLAEKKDNDYKENEDRYRKEDRRDKDRRDRRSYDKKDRKRSRSRSHKKN